MRKVKKVFSSNRNRRKILRNKQIRSKANLRRIEFSIHPSRS